MYKITFDDLDELKQAFDPRMIELAANRALNRTAIKAATLFSRSTRGQYKVKAADIKRYLKKKRSTPTTQRAELEYTSAGLPLSYFNPQEVRVVGGVAIRLGFNAKRTGLVGSRSRLSKRVKKGTTVEIRKGRRVRVKGKRGYGGFMADVRSGGLGVFERKTKARLPIQQLRTLSVPQMVEKHGLSDSVLSELEDYQSDVLAREISYRFKKAQGLL